MTSEPRRAEEAGERTARKLELATAVAHYASPVIAGTFVATYWVVGMLHSFNP